MVIQSLRQLEASALSLKMDDAMIAKMEERREEMLARRQAAGGGEGRQRGQGGEGRQRGEGGGGGQRGEGGRFASPGAVFGGAGGGERGGGGGRGGPGGGRRNIATLWYLDDAKELQMLPVRTGVTDGLLTEVTPMQEDQDLEGMEIISKVLTPSANPQPANPFGGRGGLGGFGGGGRGPGGGGRGRF